MGALVVGGEVAAGAEDILTRPYAVRLEKDLGADRIARAARAADQVEFRPVMMVGIDVTEQNRRTVDGADDGVDLAIVEEIAKGCTASAKNNRKASAFDGRNVF